MSRLRFTISMSLDGFVAGPDQSEEQPLGRGGLALHRWHFDPVDPADLPWQQQLLERGDAYIMGRNMFGPSGDRGRATGAAGGGTSRRTTHRCSC
jgi:dihydrofolate reductase